jgi:hypothetical protein
LTLDRATVSGNSATAGAAQGGDASATGGGLFVVWFFASPPTASATGSTIASNSVLGSGLGASILGSNVDTSIGNPSTFTSKNTIITGGSGAANCAQEGDGGYTSGGYNIDSGTTCLGTPTTGDQVNTSTGLGPLQDNGGLQANGDPILTRAPAIGSPAVDKGTDTGISAGTDQRGSGFARTFDMTPTNDDDGTDIGALEQQFIPSQTSVPFGTRTWGTTTTETISIVNRTGNGLDSGSLSLVGTDPGDFGLSDDECSTGPVPNNAGCLVNSAFHPVSPGNGARSASVAYSTFSPVQLVVLTGTASEFFTLLPAPHDFGSTPFNTPTGATPFTVTNTGPGTSGTMAATLTGANASEFGITQDSCTGQMLPASGTCTVSVRFAPTSAGAKSASLAVAQSGGTPRTSALTGTGTTPQSPPPAANSPTPAPATKKKCKKAKKGASSAKKKKCKRKKRK